MFSGHVESASIYFSDAPNLFVFYIGIFIRCYMFNPTDLLFTKDFHIPTDFDTYKFFYDIYIWD